MYLLGPNRGAGATRRSAAISKQDHVPLLGTEQGVQLAHNIINQAGSNVASIACSSILEPGALNTTIAAEAGLHLTRLGRLTRTRAPLSASRWTSSSSQPL
jgi:hypothetical protein